MRTTISRQRDFKQNKKAVSNIIVVVLSLVILVVIVANVVLWNYQMNQLDWDRTQENLSIDQISRIAHSPWYTTQSEYKLNRGDQIGGSYLDTQAVDGIYESFRESTLTGEIDINGTFSIDIADYLLILTQTVEIQLRYAVDDTSERWYLKAYNWTSQTYSDNGFNSTGGHAPSSGWNYYAVNLTGNWRSYVTNNGRIIVKIHDQGPDSTRTQIDIDHLAVKTVVEGAVFTIKNEGSRTTHLVSVWINNATTHKRYDTDVFINSGETFSYTRVDITLPKGQYIARVVTERGNIAVYVGD